MAKSRNPPKFYTFEVTSTNLEEYGETLADRAENWLKKSLLYNCPAVISPLHTPDNGKPHVHCIVDLTNSEYREKGLEWFAGLCKSADLPRPEIVKNVFGMELYLTHDTLQAQKEEKQRFTSEERETMRFINGYAMHELTDKGGRSEVSKVISYISLKLLDLIDSGVPCNTRALTKAVRDPAFYDELDTSLSALEVIGKGLHEVKANFRYYEKYASDTVQDIEQQKAAEYKAKQDAARSELAADNKLQADYLKGIIAALDDVRVRWVVNQLYSCNKSVRHVILSNCGTLQNCAHRDFINSYIDYCAATNTCSDEFAVLSGTLEQFNKSLGLSIGLKF